MIGFFVAANLFLFFIFWELMVVPLFLLIGVWGGPARVYAAVKFLLFTLSGSVLMLVGLIVLYLACGTLDFALLAERSAERLDPDLQAWVFAAFLAAFAVKVPMFPVHTWLPDAHTEAPTAGSVILAGVLLKIDANARHLRRRHRVCRLCDPDANGCQAPDCLFQREPHGFRDVGHLHTRAARC
jgi:NADH-quinone oxidoreductase subunit M